MRDSSKTESQPQPDENIEDITELDAIKEAALRKEESKHALTEHRTDTEIGGSISVDVGLMRNPTEKTLAADENEASYDDEVSGLNEKNTSHLDLSAFDKKTTYAPSRIKSQNDKINDYVEEIQKHKRTIEDITEKLAATSLQMNQY